MRLSLWCLVAASACAEDAADALAIDDALHDSAVDGAGPPPRFAAQEQVQALYAPYAIFVGTGVRAEGPVDPATGLVDPQTATCGWQYDVTSVAALPTAPCIGVCNAGFSLLYHGASDFVLARTGRPSVCHPGVWNVGGIGAGAFTIDVVLVPRANGVLTDYGGFAAPYTRATFGADTVSWTHTFARRP